MSRVGSIGRTDGDRGWPGHPSGAAEVGGARHDGTSGHLRGWDELCGFERDFGGTRNGTGDWLDVGIRKSRQLSLV